VVTPTPLPFATFTSTPPIGILPTLPPAATLPATPAP
jgi:hypothetical protein